MKKIPMIFGFLLATCSAASATRSCSPNDNGGIEYVAIVTGYINFGEDVERKGFKACEPGRRLILNTGDILECQGFNFSYEDEHLPDVFKFRNGEYCIIDEKFKLLESWR